MDRVVFFSGGIGSWVAARRVVADHGPDNVTLLFTDTLIEDEDLYRFLDDAAADLGAKLVKISEGRTPWQVFRDGRFIGNTRADLCSRILKREAAEKWIKANCEPASTVLYVGIDWTEAHRFVRMRDRWKPWRIEAPLCHPPMLSKRDMLAVAEVRGLRPPRLYGMGFPHNNCGGFCVKAGQAHFRLLLRQMPERYAHHEAEEEALRDHLGKDVSILRDRTGGDTRPMTLKAFRERVEGGDQGDLFEWGGCGCFVD